MPTSAHGRVAGPIGAMLLVGLVLPLSWGLGLPLLLLVGAVFIMNRRAEASARAVSRVGGWPELIASLAVHERAIIVALAVLAAVPFATVGARAIGALAMAFPAAIWSLPVALVGAFVVGRLGGRARAPAAVVVAVLVPLSAIGGARYEAGGADAQGYAHSGPILGIHPLQTTAVIVDGYGPFDIPINDYVEPDGHRGYGPETLAGAIEKALHDIAGLHFADGPAQAHRAFSRARADAVYTTPVPESLDKPSTDSEQPRFVVYSGSWGQRSRVEFVCPGARNDPRGLAPDNVMNRMCPDKYASEASAGLGVTGRWTGYMEARGNERLGLSRLLGWTRSDDEVGDDVVTIEQRLWAWGLLAVVLVLGIGRRRLVAEGLQSIAAVFAIGGLIALTGLVLAWSSPIAIGLFERPPAWTDPFDMSGWLPVLILVGGYAQLSTPTASGMTAWSVRLRTLLVLVATLGVAGSLATLDWVHPELWGDDGALALQAFVAGAASRVSVHSGLDVLVVESCAAAIVGVMVLAMLAWLVGTVAPLWPRRPGAAGGLSSRLVRAAVVLAPAAFLVVSRKTEGAATLVPGAVVSWVVLGSALHVLACRSLSGAVTRVLGHLAWVGLAIGVLFYSLHDGPGPSGFFVVCVLLGVVAVLASLALLRGGAAGASNATEAPESGG